MVATVLRIRLRILGNMLTRSVWQLIGFVFGAAAAGGAVLLVAVSLLLIGQAGVEAASAVITIGGALLIVGWGVAPLFAGGVDTTIDIDRLAPFPMSLRQSMTALTVVSLAGIPGIATTLGALSSLAAWGRWPLAVVGAIVCIPLGVLSCVLTSRTVASFATGGGRRVSNLLGLVAFAALVLAGPIATGLLGLVGGAAASGEDFVARIGGVVSGIGFTPVGAVWAAPGDLAAGRVGAAALKLLIALATIAALWMLWRRNVRASLVAPRRAAVRRSGRLGWYGVMPTGGAGATWARALHYWLTDPRYLRNLVIVAVLPILLGFALGGRIETPLFAYVGVLPALLLGLVPYADVSFDGTAFASVLASGIRGRADRAGRTLAAATVGVPLVVVVSVATVGLSGRWLLLPGVLGASLAALLVGLGVCAISSAYLVIPVPAAGDNLFKRVPGATFTTALALFGLTIAAGAVASPALALAIAAALGGGAAASWGALGVGLLLGVGACLGGVAIGGRVFDRTAPTLLARVRAIVGY